MSPAGSLASGGTLVWGKEGFLSPNFGLRLAEVAQCFRLVLKIWVRRSFWTSYNVPSASALANPHPRFQKSVRGVASATKVSIAKQRRRSSMHNGRPSGNARGWNCGNLCMCLPHVSFALPPVRAQTHCLQLALHWRQWNSLEVKDDKIKW